MTLFEPYVTWLAPKPNRWVMLACQSDKQNEATAVINRLLGAMTADPHVACIPINS